MWTYSNIETEKMPQRNQRRAGFTENRALKALLVLILTLVSVMPQIMSMVEIADNTGYPQIIGTVLSSDGPIEGARMVLSAWSGDLPSLQEVATGPNGSFMFVNLTYGSDYSLEASFNGIRHSKPVHVANDTQRVDFRFTGSLEVEVILPHGSAAEEVTLQLYTIMGINEVNATTDSRGIGVFEKLDAEDPYYVYLIHEGVTYSKIIGFDDPTTSKIGIQILETTTSDADMKVSLHHIIVSQEEDNLAFWEAADYLNTGETVFKTSWLKGWMQPDGFDITHNSMDCCTQFSEEGPYIFDPMDPLFPGDWYTLEISYLAETKVPTQIIQKKIVYDTKALYILVEKTPKAMAENLKGLELQSVENYGGHEYYLFKGSELKAGDIVSLRLKTELTVFEFLFGNPLIWGSLLLLIPAGAVVYIVAFRKKKEDPTEHALVEEISETTDLLSELNEVDSILLDLRLEYEREAITEASYKRISARYQERRSSIEEKLRIASERDSQKTQEE
jgi:hypothetical protein